MTKGKMIFAKEFVGTICAILIVGSIFMAVVLALTKDFKMRNYSDLSPTYDSLPNVMGDEGVYVAKSFFIENNFVIPQYASFGEVSATDKNSVYIRSKSASYDGRVKELDYCFTSCSQENNENEIKYITVSCDPENILKLQNKQKYNGRDYGMTINDSVIQDDDENVQTDYCYTVNFNRNADTSKKCQLTMIVTIEHTKEISSAEYKEYCDKLFYSLLDNIVYRNI